MNKRLSSLFIIAISASSLIGCANQPLVETKASSLYNGLALITSSKNYTFEVSSAGKHTFNYVFTEGSIGIYDSTNLESTDFYVNIGGAYRVNYDEGQFVRSEYLTNTNGLRYYDIWSSSFKKNLYGINAKDVLEDTSLVEKKITHRTFKSSFLSAIGLDDDMYTELDYIKAFYTDEHLNFDVKFYSSSAILNFKVTHIGDSVNEVADQLYRTNTPAFTPSESLEKMRSLIKTDNFKIGTYDVIEQTYVGQEWLTKDYWLSTYTYWGYIAFNHKANPNDPEDMDIKGCYQFGLTNDGIQFYPNKYSEMTNIVDFMGYPSKMKVLNRMEYIHEGKYEGIEEVYSYQGDAYYLTNSDYMLDLLQRFNLNPKTSADGTIFRLANPVAIVMDIKTKTAKGTPLSDKKCEVNYIYVFTYSGRTYYMPIPMADFTDVAIPALDDYLKTFNNAK